MKCDKCNKKAVYFRKYEGSYLCKQHFCESIERKIMRTIRKYKMVDKNDKLCIAVSGGKDSTSILYLMHKIFSKRKDIEIFALSIDEGSKDFRKKSFKSVSKLCKELGIKHHVFTFKKEFGKVMDDMVKKIRKENLDEPCTFCGVARRYLLNKKARELGATKLCVGHNLDDETQSILMNYIRGDLSRAARAGPVTNYSFTKKKGKMFVPRIKPLREIPEREVALYAILKGFDIDFNKKCPYRSGMRFPVKDFINDLENRYPGIKFIILQTFDRLLPSIRKISDKDYGEIVNCKKCGEPSAQKICKTCELWR